MSEMGQAERLELAVRARVAEIRWEQAEEQTELLRKQLPPFDVATEQFERLYDHEYDRHNADDVARLEPLLSEAEDEDRRVNNEAENEREEAGLQMRLAMQELHRAPGGSSMLEWAGVDDDAYERAVLEWIGVDDAAYERALQEALAVDD